MLLDLQKKYRVNLTGLFQLKFRDDSISRQLLRFYTQNEQCNVGTIFTTTQTDQTMEFSDLGKHCQHDGCRQLDFLPYTCNACNNIYCLEHRTYTDHKCTKAHEKDRLANLCPLCEKPVTVTKGQDINQVMDRHIQSGCKDEVKGRVYSNRCTFKGCKQSELVPIKCKQCTHQFCLKHRSPLDHKCAVHVEPTRNIGPFRVPIRTKS